MIRMYTEPVIELDWRKLERHLAEEIERKQALLNTLGNGDPETARAIVTSAAKFSSLLTALGADVPMKISTTTGKSIPAFAKGDDGMKALLEHPNPAVAAVAEVRLGIKSNIEEKRTARLIEVARRGPLPIMLHYYGAHTGRFSGGDKLNLQNLPSRKGNTIRSWLCAPAGQKLIACDSSQIEARMLAYVAGQRDLVEAFREGRDVYSEFATMVFGRTITKEDKTERFVGKTCILGLGYGMGHVKFRDTLKQSGLDIGEVEAKRIVQLYRSTYPMIRQLWTSADAALRSMVSNQPYLFGFLNTSAAGIELPNGLMLSYNALRETPIGEVEQGSFSQGFSYIANVRVYRKFISHGVPKEDVTWTNLYGGKVVENVIQALARIVITDQMTAIGQHYHAVFQVHDEIIINVAANEAGVAQQVVEKIMSTPPLWADTLPVACESGVGDNYGECK